MFLNFNTFQKLPATSPAARNITRFKNIFCLQKLMKKLSIHLNWKAGRFNGTIIFKTRASLLKKCKTPQINYSLHYVQLNFIASFQFLSPRNKLVSLVHFSNGSVTYYLTTTNQSLFEYYYLNTKKNLRSFMLTTYWSPVYLLKKLIFISFIEMSPILEAQYSRSPGTQSRLLVIDKTTLSALIQLPSKIKKTISYYSHVLLERIALNENKKYKNTKAGYWRSWGNKPIVRGVAMNPVDHPHGGRTKSVRYPRTPWGKTTKFK